MDDVYELRIIFREETRVVACYYLKEIPSETEVFAMTLSFISTLYYVTEIKMGISRGLFSVKRKRQVFSEVPGWSFYRVEGRKIAAQRHKQFCPIPNLKEFLTHKAPAVRNTTKKYLNFSKK